MADGVDMGMRARAGLAGLTALLTVSAAPALADHRFAPEGCEFAASLPARGMQGPPTAARNGPPGLTGRYSGYRIEAVCFPVPACGLEDMTDAQRRRELIEMAPAMGQLRGTVTRIERGPAGPVGIYEGTVPDSPRAIRMRLHWGSCSRLALLFDGDPAAGGPAWRAALETVRRIR